MASNDWILVASASASAVSGISAALAATMTVRLQRRWGSTDAFIRIAETFESPAFRKYRTLIYNLDRSGFATWTPEETAAVDAWCAHLDLVAVLVESHQISRTAFLNLYGDVALRTIYQIAPYGNDQIKTRGNQFLLPVRTMTCDLVGTWRKSTRRHRYPTIIGFPAQPKLRVSPDLFRNDTEVGRFQVKRHLD